MARRVLGSLATTSQPLVASEWASRLELAPMSQAKPGSSRRWADACHYHGLTVGLINRLGEGVDGTTDMIAGGFAADGFPFYLRYRDQSDQQSGFAAAER